MATIDTVSGGGAGRRSLDHDIPLIPFIDFLLCLMAFLLVTAVWSQMARLDADAKVPGLHDGPAEELPKRLHVMVKSKSFELSWRQGQTVLSQISVPRSARRAADGTLHYPEFAERLHSEWSAHGLHRAPSDAKRDRAVMHVQNDEEYGEIVAVMDALNAPRRPIAGSAQPVFQVALATD